MNVKRKARVDVFAPLLEDGVTKKVAGQGGWLIVGQVTRFVVFFASQVLVMWIIEPIEFAKLVYFGPVTGLLILLTNAGLSAATVRLKVVEAPVVSGLFWVSMGMGVVGALLLLSLTPAIELWFRAEDLWLMGVAFAASILTQSLLVQHSALFRRSFAIRESAQIEVVSSLVRNGSMLGIAYVTKSVAAVPFGMAIGNATNFLGRIFFCQWLPGRPAPLSELKVHLTFGGKILGTGLLHVASALLISIVMGRHANQLLLSYWERISGIIMDVTNRLGGLFAQVFLPAMVSKQEDDERFRLVAGRFVGLAGYLWTPFCWWIAGMSHGITPTIFGSEWADAGTYLLVLAIGASLWTPRRVLQAALVAKGRANALLVANSIQLVCVGVSIVLGLAGNMTWFVVSMGILGFLASLLVMSMYWHQVFGRIEGLAVALFGPLLLGAMAFVVGLVITPMFGSGFAITGTFVVGCVLIFVLSNLDPRFRGEFFQLVSRVRSHALGGTNVAST